MRIEVTSVLVDDQEKALKFYTDILGFQKKQDFPAGGGRWLTVVSPERPDGVELLLEPIGYDFATTYQKSLFDAGIPLTMFFVDDIQAEYKRLTDLGVSFTGEPQQIPDGPTIATFDDTCGNLILLAETASS